VAFSVPTFSTLPFSFSIAPLRQALKTGVIAFMQAEAMVVFLTHDAAESSDKLTLPY